MAQVQKIAILGGGAGALAAAFFLSSQPGWRERFEITVYQQGWRLGGKGASGRNARLAQRIEEHGLHIWFGFYANAFALMRAAYAELARPAGAPLARWDEAFRPHDYVALMNQQGGAWQPWHIVLPRRAGEPGTGSEPVTPWALALEAIRLLRLWQGALRTLAPAAGDDAPCDALLALAGALPPDARDHTDRDHELLARAIDRMRAQLSAQAGLAAAGGELQRLLVALNIGTTVLKGMLADGIFARGFSVANDEDLRGWLARHGGDQALCIDSAPVRAMYDLLFAYVDGDPERPNLEAGTALRWALRMAFAYRGSVMYKMQAGMGDAVFAPLYEVLARRGVSFRFFHRVEEIVPDAGGVATVRCTVQAATSGEYRPLVEVKGLPCWPATPDFAQLDPVQAALMQEHGADLESSWSDWPRLYCEAFGKPLPELVLERGRDFDQVVCAIPLGALPQVAPRVLQASPVLRAAAGRIPTVATQALQLWLDRDLPGLGWSVQPDGQQPVLTGFADPYDTWAPMDQVLAHEDWPGAAVPKGVSYFCSTMKVDAYPPRHDSGFPARAAAQAKQDALALLSGRIENLWPAARGGMPWHWLHDPAGAQGPSRLDRQYWRANVDPSERYILSVAGSSGYRPHAAGSGLDNLYLAGDWLRTGLDSGCVEAAVMGGMQAARALSGYPERIEADSDFPDGGGRWATT